MYGVRRGSIGSRVLVPIAAVHGKAGPGPATEDGAAQPGHRRGRCSGSEADCNIFLESRQSRGVVVDEGLFGEFPK